MRLAGWVAILACLPLSTLGILTLEYWRAESYWPAPGGREAGNEPQSHTDAADQQTGNQSGTSQNPFVVKIAPSPNAQPETAAQRKERQQKASEDWWAVAFAGVAALGAVGLVFVTGGLWVYTYRLWRATLKAVEGEERAIKAALDHVRESARAADAMKDAADAMGKQALLAHQNYLATHRPRLRVRRVQTDGGRSDNIGATWIIVANVGATEAKNIRFDAVFAKRTGNIRLPPWTEKLVPQLGRGPDAILPGQRGTYEVPCVDPEPSAPVQMFPPQVTLIAEFIYGDHNGVDRRSGIGWPYRPIPGEFERVGEEDEYNYED